MERFCSSRQSDPEKRSVMRFGINMYGVAKEFHHDPESFLKEISSFGYRRIEPCISFESQIDLRGNGFWSSSDLVGYLPFLRAHDIDIRSAHVFASDLTGAIPEMIHLAETADISQYIIKCPQDISIASYQRFADTCIFVADALSPHGISVLLHNQATEIHEHLEGVTAYEWLLHACHKKVYAQPDIGWLAAGGEDPEAFLWRNACYVKSVHYKDMKLSYDHSDMIEVPLGHGFLDLRACFQFARANGASQIVDMDSCTMSEVLESQHLLSSLTQERAHTTSQLCTLDTVTGSLTILHSFDHIIEAPNWLPDGNAILYNADGHIFRYQIDSDTSEKIDTADCAQCNNDHVPSPDGKSLAISCSPPGSYLSAIYTLPITGGQPRRVTSNAPSYLHGWSPDGKELSYCAFRPNFDNDTTDVDIYTIPVCGGTEKRLTNAEGFNDGPEYDPNGQHIWFNSTRSGLMQIWRMNRDGSAVKQLTFSEANNWFPHISPDGRQVFYLTFRKDELEPNEHLPNMKVSLSVMNYDGSGNHKLLDFFGGQGSVNVNSWAPDSRHIALVQYYLQHP